MRKYHPSNRVPFPSFILLLLLAIISGAVLGGILWAVDDLLHFYLVIVFPLFAGAIVGGLLTLVVRSGKVRSPFIAALMGVIAALVMFAVYHGADYYITFRNTFRDVYVQQTGKTPPDTQLSLIIDQALQSEGYSTGFVGYLQYAANEGFSVTNSTYSTDNTDDLNLKGNLVWGYWVVEILIAAIVAGAVAAGAARQPFDEETNTWYGKPTLLGITSTKTSKALTNALKDGDFQTAGSLLTTQQIKYPRHEVLLRRGTVAGSVPQQQDIYLTVNYAQRRGRTVVKRSGLVSPSELDLIKRSMPGIAAPNVATSKR